MESTGLQGEETQSMTSGHKQVPLKQIGPYRVMELLGTGGMGEVYKAERRHPIRQTVAIKIIKLGFDSREVIARFESERQALARMDHPHIARVLDAGISETGRPYFVMEYVPGVPITKFCDDNKLTIKDRLLLFTQACDAVAHAHTKAIIHRDLKAANVLAFLYDNKPTVKIIDFGIAKALTSDRLTEQTFNTERGQIIGTYDSMSPEQADGSPDIDTRTDVYSLGVLLYELLTGVQPFDHETLARSADQEIRRIIREVEPPRPSTRLTTMGAAAQHIATARRLRVDELTRGLRAELEWIPIKAMRKERDRRYGSALELALDIQNYFQRKPLLAGPESHLYLTRKFITRNAVGIAALTGTLILVGAAIFLHTRELAVEQRKTLIALAEAQTRRSEAEAANEGSRAVNDFLVRMLSANRPQNAAGKVVTVQEVLDQAADSARQQFRDHPLSEATIRVTLGITYRELGHCEKGIEQLRQGLSIRERVLGKAHRETIEAMNSLAYALVACEKFREAKQIAEASVHTSETSLGPDDKETWALRGTMALALNGLGEFAEAERVRRESLSWSRRTRGIDAMETVWEINSLGWVLQCAGKLTEAETCRREALEICLRTVGRSHSETFISMWGVGRVLKAQGRFAEALPLLREACGLSPSMGPNHPDHFQCQLDLSEALAQTGSMGEAEALARDALNRTRASFGPHGAPTLQSARILVKLLDQMSRPVEATALRSEYDLPRQSTPPTDGGTSAPRTDLTPR